MRVAVMVGWVVSALAERKLLLTRPTRIEKAAIPRVADAYCLIFLVENSSLEDPPPAVWCDG